MGKGKRVRNIVLRRARSTRIERREPGLREDGQVDALDDFEMQHEHLVRRLRDMTWPEVPSEVRERCWREFQEMMVDSGRLKPEPNGDRAGSSDEESANRS